MSDIPETERRKDINTRKVIEVLSAKLDESLEEKLKRVVTWERLIFILGASSVVIVSAAWKVTAMAASGAEDAAHGARSEVSQVRKDSGEALQLVREELRDTRGDIRSLYRSLRTNQPQPRLAAPVPELPPNPLQGDAGNGR